MLPDIMTAEQLAKYLQLDEQTIYRKTRTGQIPGVRIGKTLRFKRDVIDSWLRLSSFQWNSAKREELRIWAGSFAKDRGLKEKDIQKIISKKRYGK
ncbi:MAG: helix-turn-helix domain-containing protein [Candidatus Omnitrophota bacterium]